MLRKRTIYVAVLVAALAFGGILLAKSTARTGEPVVKDQAASLMRQKLVHAQSILEGLALEDYEKIHSSAMELQRISVEAQWEKRRTPEFDQLSAEFRFGADKTARMAEDRNLEGATLTFMQVVVSCVECHKLIRDNIQIAEPR